MKGNCWFLWDKVLKNHQKVLCISVLLIHVAVDYDIWHVCVRILMHLLAYLDYHVKRLSPGTDHDVTGSDPMCPNRHRRAPSCAVPSATESLTNLLFIFKMARFQTFVWSWTNRPNIKDCCFDRNWRTIVDFYQKNKHLFNKRNLIVH